MPRIAYVEKTFRKSSLAVIQQANTILREYGAAGFDLTLRQLYYQFVARDLIPNTQKSYKRLGSIVNDARLAGHINWSYIVDRTRNLQALGHWDEPLDIIESAAASFRVDLWETQPYYCEAWIEKDALVGVLKRICNQLDIPFFSCRGYTSQSELWGAAQRIIRETRDGRSAVIFYLGDHDPSTIDMTRDIAERFWMFGAEVDVRRLARAASSWASDPGKPVTYRTQTLPPPRPLGIGAGAALAQRGGPAARVFFVPGHPPRSLLAVYAHAIPPAPSCIPA
jgi:hypothetical protein